MSHCLRLVLTLALAGSGAAQNVHIVHPGVPSSTGLGPLQDAIDIAEDGDVIALVNCAFYGCFPTGEPIDWSLFTPRVGTYAGIPATNATVIDNKSLTFVGQIGPVEKPSLSGPLLVLGSGEVRFRGVRFTTKLEFTPTPGSTVNDPHHVRAVDFHGSLTFEECSFLVGSFQLAQPNFELETGGMIDLSGGSADLTLVRCYIQSAGNGFSPTLARPKRAIAATGAHRLALYDNILLAGNGIAISGPEAIAGAACVTLDGPSSIYVAGGLIQGGSGAFTLMPDAPPGGDALVLHGGATAVLRDAELIGGPGGNLFLPVPYLGPEGLAINAPLGSVEELAGPTHDLVVNGGGDGIVNFQAPFALKSNTTGAVLPLVLVSLEGGFAPLGALGVVQLGFNDAWGGPWVLPEPSVELTGAGLPAHSPWQLHVQGVTLDANSVSFGAPSFAVFLPPGLVTP